MSDILISGYHGFANSGDEALLFAILSTLRSKKADLDVTVLSKTPRETENVYRVKSIYRYNIFKIIGEMKKTKMLLFGGGSLIQDVTSSKSIFYYLLILSLAKRMGMKTMLYANGIGPVRKRFNRFITAKILNKIDVITLRDDKSDEELKSMGVTAPDITITADPAFTLDVDGTLSGKYFTNMAGVPEGRKIGVVSIREWKESKADFVGEMARLCDYMVDKHGIYPLFVPMQYPADLGVSAEVMSRMNNPSYVINRELSVPEVFSVLSEAEIIVGMRLHSLIYATTLGIPAMALVYDPKVSAFMESINQPDCVNIEDMTFDRSSAIMTSIINDSDKRREELLITNKVLRKEAERNALFAIELLER